MHKTNIIKQPRIVLSNIPNQNLRGANQLTIDQWNDIINKLRTQADLTVEYMHHLHQILFYRGTDEGVLTLDGVPDNLGLLTDTILRLRGQWDPDTNTPELKNLDQTKRGLMYQATADGVNDEAGVTVKKGDYVLYNNDGILYNYTSFLDDRAVDYVADGIAEAKAYTDAAILQFINEQLPNIIVSHVNGLLQAHNSDQNAHPYIQGITATKVSKDFDDLDRQTTTNLNDFLLVNRFGNSYKVTVGDLLKAVGVTDLFVPVLTLPEVGQINKIYLVPSGGETDRYEEYIYVDDHWESIGGVTVNLENYYTKAEVDDKLAELEATLKGEGVIDNTTTKAVYTLVIGRDMTYTQPLTELTITVPVHFKQGSYANVNFVTDVVSEEYHPPRIIVSNGSSLPLKIRRYNLDFETIDVQANKYVNVAFYCDGLCVYCYYNEVSR